MNARITSQRPEKLERDDGQLITDVPVAINQPEGLLGTTLF